MVFTLPPDEFPDTKQCPSDENKQWKNKTIKISRQSFLIIKVGLTLGEGYMLQSQYDPWYEY